MSSIRGHAILFSIVVAAAPACTDAELDTDVQELGGSTPVGLAVEVDNATGVPLQLKRGQTYYLNQIDLRASITAAIDEGVAGLARSGDFADLRWGGIAQADQEFILLANGDGTFR